MQILQWFPETISDDSPVCIWNNRWIDKLTRNWNWHRVTACQYMFILCQWIFLGKHAIYVANKFSMLLDSNKRLLMCEVNTTHFSISFNVIKLIAPFLDSMKYCLNGQKELYWVYLREHVSELVKRLYFGLISLL